MNPDGSCRFGAGTPAGHGPDYRRRKSSDGDLRPFFSATGQQVSALRQLTLMQPFFRQINTGKLVQAAFAAFNTQGAVVFTG